MLELIYRNTFEKDVKRVKTRGKDLAKLRQIIQYIVEEKELPHKVHDHQLIGDFIGRRECHIESDGLLIYKMEPERVILERTGTHSDLFK